MSLHHILFDPLSVWEHLKVQAMVTVLVIPVFLVAARFTGRKW
jgi:hypothetical protein